jgi:hypothetical protein
MRDHFAEVPEIVVMVDRRCGDRRRQESGGPTDRRRGERRAAPARTWTTLGFLTAPVLDQVTCDHVPA